LHVLIRKDFVQRWLGKPGLGGVVKASVLGVPMPLCSCSVIPVAASLHKSGATRGATASFLSSTPQTGVDSIMATYALLGGLFTAVRVLVAFVCGIMTGYLIELLCRESKMEKEAPPSFQAMAETTFTMSPQATSPIKVETKCCCASNAAPKKNPMEAFRYSFVTLPADLARALIIGLLLAGLITTLIPENMLSGNLSSGPLAFLLATAISLPLYVCSTASIPMAYALMAAGLSPGAALVFLITGPATNTATIVTVWQMLGRAATAIHLVTLIIVSWLSGWLFNEALNSQQNAEVMHHHEALHPSHWQHGSGVLLIALLLFSIVATRKKAKKSCCAD
jgi:uncharacterized membrane protein YraQ (UPF0718 family)